MPSSPQTIAVIGATGGQGGGVVSSFLSAGYSVRAITRNTTSDKALALRARGVDVVSADFNNIDSLVAAFADVHIIFAVTDFIEPFRSSGGDAEHAQRVEAAQGINLAKAASLTPSLQHFLWSTLPNARAITKGKYIIAHYEGKNAVDSYIKSDKSLLSKTTFLWCTWFAHNQLNPAFKPTFHSTSGKYLFFQPTSPSTPIYSLGDHSKNVGPFALAAVEKPQVSLPGRAVVVATEKMTLGGLLEIWGKVAGKETEFVEVGLDLYDRLFPGIGREVGLMMMFWGDFALDEQWIGENGEKPVTAEDLGITGLGGVEVALRELELLE